MNKQALYVYNLYLFCYNQTRFLPLYLKILNILSRGVGTFSVQKEEHLKKFQETSSLSRVLSHSYHNT